MGTQQFKLCIFVCVNAESLCLLAEHPVLPQCCRHFEKWSGVVGCGADGWKEPGT